MSLLAIICHKEKPCLLVQFRDLGPDTPNKIKVETDFVSVFYFILRNSMRPSKQINKTLMGLI